MLSLLILKLVIISFEKNCKLVRDSLESQFFPFHSLLQSSNPRNFFSKCFFISFYNLQYIGKILALISAKDVI